MVYLVHFLKRLQSFSGRILYINILGMVIVSFLQGMEIFLLIPIISVSGIMGVDTGVNTITGISKYVPNFANGLGLPLVLGIYILIVLGQCLLQRNINTRNVKIQQGFILHLRVKIYQAILESNWDFFIKRRKSDIINSLTTELVRVSAGLAVSLQLLTYFIFTLIQIGLALLLSVKLTIFIMICGLLHVSLTRNFVKRAKKLGNLTSELSQIYLAGITDQLNGIKDIKINTLEQSRLSWLRSINMKMQYEQSEYIHLKANSELLSKMSSAIFISIFIFLSVKVFNARPEQLLLVIMIFFRIWPRITGIQASVEQIASSIPAFRTIIELERECYGAKELNNGNQINDDVKPLRVNQGLKCRNICFRYNPEDSMYALQDITIDIPANNMTAIVGKSGAGKSTLIDILMGLIMPEEGQVLVDDDPLSSDNILALRRAISYVPQDPFLFNASIRENLLLVEPNATDKDIWEALEFAASDEFVNRLPQGLDTLIGDRGIRLSGGERQRLVLARAVLRRPSILVLDEATSSLDTENEKKIQEVLDRIKDKITIIVIAHRLSTIRNADQVIVLDRGKVIQKGGFNQLALEKRGIFSSLLGNQIGYSN